jgi:predicted dehydrogenase
VNLGIHQPDVSVVWDLGPHDFSILRYWLNELPVRVSAMTRGCVIPSTPDVAFIDLAFGSGTIAHVELAWLAPSKLRRTTIVGSRKMVVYDDVAEDKIAIYDKGIDRKAVLGEHMDFDQPAPLDFSYRSGDIVLPQVRFVEPLRLEAEHFVECIRTGTEPATGVTHARAVVSILERADASRPRVHA